MTKTRHKRTGQKPPTGAANLMPTISPCSRSGLTRRALAILLLCGGIAGCGGGGGGEDVSAMQGSREARAISSRITGTRYTLNIYLPPASAGPRNSLPIIYVLDGESWFDPLVRILESTRTPALIVGIDSAGQRSHDFVPVNSCTSGGGGQVAYFDFIRQELVPFVEGAFGGDPRQRALFGHSHGGSFVLYAMFSEPPGEHSFKAYLASDSSVSCMPVEAKRWEQAYAASYRSLPVRLQLSYATLGNYAANREYASAVEQRHYEDLILVDQAYTGTHGGIVPQVLEDGVPFAFPTAP